MSPDGFLLSARPWNERTARGNRGIGLNESPFLDFNLLKIRGWTRIWMDSRLGSLKCLSGRLRVAAANHRIRRPGRCGIRSIRRRDPGIRESSRAHGLKRMELRSCRGDPSRPTSPLPPSISFSLFPRGYRRCAAEFYLFVGGGGLGVCGFCGLPGRGIYFGVFLDPLYEDRRIELLIVSLLGGLLRRLFAAVVRDYHRVLSDKSSGNFDY